MDVGSEMNYWKHSVKKKWKQSSNWSGAGSGSGSLQRGNSRAVKADWKQSNGSRAVEAEQWKQAVETSIGSRVVVGMEQKVGVGGSRGETAEQWKHIASGSSVAMGVDQIVGGSRGEQQNKDRVEASKRWKQSSLVVGVDRIVVGSRGKTAE